MSHSAAFVALVDDAKSRVREIDVASVCGLQERGASFALIDVREDGEWASGHVAGAQHIGRGVLERDIERILPDKSAPIVLYCGGGFRSALAGDSIQKMGYTSVTSLAGGWKAWVAAGAPTEKG
jgi:rhodanese-related sulfurtransferase